MAPLLQKVTWKWGTAQEQAFDEAKELLQSPHPLAHYESEVVLSCDVSPYRIDAVLAHHHADGIEQPIGLPLEHWHLQSADML